MNCQRELKRQHRRSVRRSFPHQGSPDHALPPDLARAKTGEKTHGRIEIRQIAVSSEVAAHLKWPGAAQVARIKRHRRMHRRDSVEVVYLVTSLCRHKKPIPNACCAQSRPLGHQEQAAPCLRREHGRGSLRCPRRRPPALKPAQSDPGAAQKNRPPHTRNPRKLPPRPRPNHQNRYRKDSLNDLDASMNTRTDAWPSFTACAFWPASPTAAP